jgi:hypothetical protein
MAAANCGKAHQCAAMCTPDILADRTPLTTYDTPASTHHVIIVRAELQDRRQCRAIFRTAKHPMLTKLSAEQTIVSATKDGADVMRGEG